MNIKKLIEKCINDAIMECLNDAGEESNKENDFENNPMLGKPVLVRDEQDGVNVGILYSTSKDSYILQNQRKLWRWQAKQGVALESVAKYGVKEGTRATGVTEYQQLMYKNLNGMKSIDDINVYHEIMSFPVSDQS